MNPKLKRACALLLAVTLPFWFIPAAIIAGMLSAARDIERDFLS